jgi:hypothetical protein
MPKDRRKTLSQILAATVSLAAVLIMLSPLRRGPDQGDSQQAGWLPLLSHGGLADGAAFHRLEAAGTRHHASAVPLQRSPMP